MKKKISKFKLYYNQKGIILWLIELKYKCLLKFLNYLDLELEEAKK